MAGNTYYGNDMVLSMTTETGTTITVGVLKDVEIVAAATHDDLYGADSTERQNVKRREHAVQVTIGFAKMDMTMIQQWLGGSGQSSTSFRDTSDPAQFEVTGEVTPAGGGSNKKAVVEEVDFEEMPVLSVTEGEWETTELEGTGTRLTATGP